MIRLMYHNGDIGFCLHNNEEHFVQMSVLEYGVFRWIDIYNLDIYKNNPKECILHTLYRTVRNKYYRDN